MQALVFSAGGAFGAYQAGVWRALEERGFRPDIIVGASVGAINAAAVARGSTGSQLEQWWRDPKSGVFRWNWPLKSLGLLDPSPLQSRLEELFREFSQPVPGVRLLMTLTELPSTRIRVVSDGSITPGHVLASCAVPLFYAPVRLAGRSYVDGGVFCRMPVALAAEAGASEIISVDLLAAPPSPLARGMLNAAVRLRRLLVHERNLSAVPSSVPQSVRLWRVESRRPLGKFWDILRWSPENIDRWIEAGYCEAAAVWERRERASHASAAQPSSPRVDRAAPT